MSCDRLGVDEEWSDSEDEEEQHTANQVVGGSPSSLDGAAGTSDAGPSSSCTLQDSPGDEATPTSNTPVTVSDGKELAETEKKKDLVDKDDEHAVKDASQSDGYEVRYSNSAFLQVHVSLHVCCYCSL